MSKLITFGCSFTQWESWSTWADILGREFDSFINLGKNGAGNTYIFNHVMQCIAQEQITADTTVIIMWSNVIREDRYVDNSWIVPGCLYNQRTYGPAFMQYVDPVGLFVRDCAHIAAVTHALTNTGCTFHYLSMMPMDSVKEYLKLNFVESLMRSDTVSVYKRKYKKYLDLIKPSVLEVVYNNNWYTRRDDLVKDRAWYSELGDDLPSIDDIVNKRVTQQQQEFLCTAMNAETLQEIIDFKLWERIDHHPTPLLHLEYLDSVLPEYTISTANREQIAHEDSTLSK